MSVIYRRQVGEKKPKTTVRQEIIFITGMQVIVAELICPELTFAVDNVVGDVVVVVVVVVVVTALFAEVVVAVALAAVVGVDLGDSVVVVEFEGKTTGLPLVSKEK